MMFADAFARTSVLRAMRTALHTLRLGDDGAFVEDLQRGLVAMGFSVGRYGVDGQYGDATQWALTRAIWQAQDSRVMVFEQSDGPGEMSRRLVGLQLRELGATDYVIFVDGLDHPLTPRWPAAEVATWCSALRDDGIRPHLMFAPEAGDAEVRRFLDLVDEIGSACRPASIILDVEEQWAKRGSRHDQHAATIIAALDGTPWGVTAVPYLPSRVRPFVEAAPVLIPQTYSQRWKDPKVQYAYDPGTIHETAARRWGLERHPFTGETRRDVIWGCAGYRQSAELHDVERAMAEVVRRGGHAIAIWSSANLRSSKNQRTLARYAELSAPPVSTAPLAA